MKKAVVCIDNEGYEEHLTVGKSYEVLNSYGYTVEVLSDNGFTKIATFDDKFKSGGIIVKAPRCGALTGDNRIDSLRTIQSLCRLLDNDSEEIRQFKEKILWYAEMGQK